MCLRVCFFLPGESLFLFLPVCVCNTEDSARLSAPHKKTNAHGSGEPISKQLRLKAHFLSISPFSPPHRRRRATVVKPSSSTTIAGRGWRTGAGAVVASPPSPPSSSEEEPSAPAPPCAVPTIVPSRSTASRRELPKGGAGLARRAFSVGEAPELPSS